MTQNAMDYKYIEQLIERYFNAETTLQEEQILRSFFAQAHNKEQGSNGMGTVGDTLPEELACYAPLFTVLDNKEHLSEDFDNRMLALIGQQKAQSDNTQDSSQPHVKARKIRLGERLRPLFKAAAIVAILITIGNAVNQSLEAVEVWEEPKAFADAQQQNDNAVALEGVSIDSATLYGQALVADSIQADTIHIQY